MNHKKSEWSKYVDDKALLRVNGKIKFKMHGYDGIVSRDNNTHCLFVKIYLKDTKKLSDETLEELKEIIYHSRIKFESQFDEYYIEFNSASLEDYIPAYEQLGLNKNKTYKDLKFIKNETKKIICFLIERGIR
jgi:hypothetical protein|nr:MAG TPA: hypothetical protein [Caudoviricetes sp.]